MRSTGLLRDADCALQLLHPVCCVPHRLGARSPAHRQADLVLLGLGRRKGSSARVPVSRIHFTAFYCSSAGYPEVSPLLAVFGAALRTRCSVGSPRIPTAPEAGSSNVVVGNILLPARANRVVYREACPGGAME